MSGNDIDFKLLSISTCFQNNFYDVPDYQREYVWEEKEVNQLLEDIFDEYEEDPKKEYFIGSTVTLKTGENNFDLIDGQQRTTTLFLLACAFRNAHKNHGSAATTFDNALRFTSFNENGEITRNRIALQYLSTNDVIDSVIDGKRLTGGLNQSGKRIINALEIIEFFLETRFKNDLEGLKKFWFYCYSKVKFIQIETSDISRALKIFETINERGVGLNSMDLLKNLLFRQAKTSEFPAIKTEWETIIRLLESRKEKPLRFLRYFVMANYSVEIAGAKDIVREDQIYGWFSKNEDKWSEAGNYRKFLGILKDNAEQFCGIGSGQRHSQRHIYLENIKYLGGPAFRQHLILLLAAKHLPSDQFDNLCKNFESLMFSYFVTKENSRNYEARFSGWASKFRRIASADEYSAILKSTIIAEYEARKFDFLSAMKTLSSKSMPAYRVKYILSKIAAHIESERSGGNSSHSISEYMESAFEIEHIAPQNPTHEYKQKIESYDEIKLRLGNLTLLEKSINGSIGRGDFFEVKKTAYQNSSLYLTRSLSKTERVGANTALNRTSDKLREYNQWGSEEVMDRQEKIADLAMTVWKIRDFK